MGRKYSSIQEAIDSLDSHFQPENAPDIDATFQLDFSGEGGGQWLVSIKDKELTVLEGVHADPSITLTASAEDWLKVLNGEANPAILLMKGKLKLTGDMGLAMKFQSIFSRSE